MFPTRIGCTRSNSIFIMHFIEAFGRCQNRYFPNTFQKQILPNLYKIQNHIPTLHALIPVEDNDLVTIIVILIHTNIYLMKYIFIV